MPREPIGESASSRALDLVLTEGGEVADAISSEIHRTMLWRFRNGRRKPDANTAAKLHRLSGGRVDASGWTSDIATRRAQEPRTGTGG
jgi:hypothetical protein